MLVNRILDREFKDSQIIRKWKICESKDHSKISKSMYSNLEVLAWQNDFRVPCFHYTNTPMQYTAIFHGCKNVNFQMKNYNIFLIFAQNIDCGYTH